MSDSRTRIIDAATKAQADTITAGESWTRAERNSRLAAAAETCRILKERIQAECRHVALSPGVGHDAQNYAQGCFADLLAEVSALLSEIESERPNSEGVIRERTSATEGDGVSVSVPTSQLSHDAIEVRLAGGADVRRIDEIVASNASVHLEQMSETEYTLIVETAAERACFSIHACNSRSHIRTTETWKEDV